jgi:hypothetical protein
MLGGRFRANNDSCKRGAERCPCQCGMCWCDGYPQFNGSLSEHFLWPTLESSSIIERMDLMLLVTILQFLATVYQISRPNEQIVRVIKEVAAEVETDMPIDGVQFVNEQFQKRLESKDALVVSNDISLLTALFSFRATTESFNYFGVLFNVLSSVVGFCTRHHIFLLRGMGYGSNKVLPLKRAAHVLCPPMIRKTWVLVKNAQYSTPSTSNVNLYLVQSMKEPQFSRPIERSNLLPVVGDALVAYRESFMEGGSEPRTEMLHFYVAKGAESHWIGFVSDGQSRTAISFQRMLKAIEVESIIGAIRDDILEYVTDIRKDQEHSETALRDAADKFLKALNPPQQ